MADETLEAAFWKYYRIDSLHSFHPAGSSVQGQAFNSSLDKQQ